MGRTVQSQGSESWPQLCTRRRRERARGRSSLRSSWVVRRARGTSLESRLERRRVLVWVHDSHREWSRPWSSVHRLVEERNAGRRRSSPPPDASGFRGLRVQTCLLAVQACRPHKGRAMVHINTYGISYGIARLDAGSVGDQVEVLVVQAGSIDSCCSGAGSNSS